MSTSDFSMTDVVEQLKRIEALLLQLVAEPNVKQWYSTAEVATILARSIYTVREWCRENRVHAEKRPCGRGSSNEWVISHEEITRIQNEGLLPQ